MKTVLVQKPAQTALTLQSVMDHCRVSADHDEPYILSLIETATEHLEQVLGRKLISQTWKLILDDWPDDAEIILPFGECTAVSSIVYRDQAGQSITWAPANYVVDAESMPARVQIAYDKSWPADTLFQLNPIAVEFVSGYGATSADIPASLQHALRYLVAHWYDNREMLVASGAMPHILPNTVDRLIWPYRIFGF